jgi:tRNA-specific 2-thiouridylase
MKKKVIAAMSGGVDSSVAALLLRQAGYEVIGVTMQIWPQAKDQSKACCSFDAVSDAQKVAWKLGISHYVVNFRQEFAEKVIKEFCGEYLAGRTPNPCISCNRFIKFQSLLQKAQSLGADFIATGHYVRREYDPSAGKWLLKTGADESKDQSYVLYHMTQEQLAHTLFPLGAFRKSEIRDIARKEGLVVADKAESQEICFISGHYGDFVENYCKAAPSAGNFIDSQGNTIGRHRGIHRYTVGQHKGLGLAVGRPLYVTRIDPSNNTVQVGSKEELFHKKLIAGRPSFIAGRPPAQKRITAKIRYNAPKVPAELYSCGDTAEVEFFEPQRSITPGQAVVFYDGDTLLGGATIESYAD